MSVEFVDTNVLIYAHDATAGVKRATAAGLLDRLSAEGNGAVSIQVLSEFYSVTTRKFKLSDQRAEALMSVFGVWAVHCPEFGDLLRASQLRRRYGIAWWDALIVNSAIELGCRTLWTEDLADGQEYGPVTARNPFTP